MTKLRRVVGVTIRGGQEATPPQELPVSTLYSPELFIGGGISNFESVPGGTFTLSAFNADGIATGQMNTAEGIVPRVVENCR